MGKLDPNTRNNDTGIQITRSRRVVVGVPFGELATIIKVGTAGKVVWKNSLSDEVGVWDFEAGEGWPISCTEILTSATIDGVLETTGAGTILWASAASSMVE